MILIQILNCTENIPKQSGPFLKHWAQILIQE